jgi:hypothetical protein
MQHTGGVIHALSAIQAAHIASLLRAHAANAGLRLSIAWSAADGESRCDPAAIDPNDFLAKPGETPQEAFEHTDFGLEQEDGSTAEGDPSFAGLDLLAMRLKLLDPEYGAQFICETTARNLKWAARCFADDPSLKEKVPNGDPDVLGAQAYNLGQNGALHLAHTHGLKGDWSYGLGVVQRAAAVAYLDNESGAS